MYAHAHTADASGTGAYRHGALDDRFWNGINGLVALANSSTVLPPGFGRPSDVVPFPSPSAATPMVPPAVPAADQRPLPPDAPIPVNAHGFPCAIVGDQAAGLLSTHASSMLPFSGWPTPWYPPPIPIYLFSPPGSLPTFPLTMLPTAAFHDSRPPLPTLGPQRRGDQRSMFRPSGA